MPILALLPTLWPIIKWALQALGFMGPEDKEKEREYQLKLLEAAEKKEAALIQAFSDFQKLWRPPAERVYVWANTIIALFQPAIVALAWYGFITGVGITRAKALNDAGMTGWLLAAVMLFPLYGPVIAPSVGEIFKAGIGAALNRKPGSNPTSPTSPVGGSPLSPTNPPKPPVTPPSPAERPGSDRL